MKTARRKRGADKKRWVYEFGSAPGAPIVLLHELPGVTRSLTELAENLCNEGFRVFVPELLPAWGNFNLATVCLSRQFTAISGGRPSRISDWIRDLCTEIAQETDQKVAVIGMCATGGIVLSLLYDDHVRAGVMAQPSMPFRLPRATITRCELGCSGLEAKNSAKSGKPVLAMRFKEDRLCPAGRFAQLDELWEAEGDSSNLKLVVFPGRQHSTITVHKDCARFEGKTSTEILLDWLRANLG